MPLGMEDERITKLHLRASSMYSITYGPWRARLQSRNTGGSGGWVSKYNNRNQWIQADLETLARVKRIATQGRYEAAQWVSLYKISYSINGIKFYPYTENRKVKVGKLRRCIWTRVKGGPGCEG